MAILSVFAFVFAVSAGVGEAAHGMRGAHGAERVSRERVTQQLKQELEALLGHGESYDRLARLEAAFRPTFDALPKTADGGLDEGMARYALHRFFVREHGWQVQGLDVPSERNSQNSSTSMLKSKMPSMVLDLVETHMEGRHVGPAELAVLAATVEDLVFSDAVELLSSVYEVDGTAREEMLTRGYLLLYAMPNLRSAVNSGSLLRRLVNRVHKYYPGWEDLVMWTQDLKETMRYRNRVERNPFAKSDIDFTEFSAMGQIAETVTEQFGKFQDVECKALKNQLLELEDNRRNDGRVQLSKFYSAFLKEDTMYFSESKEYLRHYGALDETDPQRPSVIISNYIYGESN